MRLHLSKLGNCDFQHTIDGFCLDVLGVRGIRQAEAALEFPTDAFDATRLAGFATSLLALSANREHALVGRDLHGFGIHTRQVDVQYELIRFLADVDWGQPGARVGGGGLRCAEQTIDIFLEPADERPRLITYDGHCVTPELKIKLATQVKMLAVQLCLASKIGTKRTISTACRPLTGNGCWRGLREKSMEHNVYKMWKHKMLRLGENPLDLRCPQVNQLISRENLITC